MRLGLLRPTPRTPCRVRCKSGAHCTAGRLVRRNAASPFAPHPPDAMPRRVKKRSALHRWALHHRATWDSAFAHCAANSKALNAPRTESPWESPSNWGRSHRVHGSGLGDKGVVPQLTPDFVWGNWCCRRGLNSRPLPYQGSALPLSYGSNLEYPRPHAAAPARAPAGGQERAPGLPARSVERDHVPPPYVPRNHHSEQPPAVARAAKPGHIEGPAAPAASRHTVILQGSR